MAKQRREIEVFTVSSLNLLSKALGAVILLFIIIPKVTFRQKNLLEHLPKNLDTLAKNLDLRFINGDSIGTMLLVDSSLLNLKNQKRKIDSLIGKLDSIKVYAGRGKYEYQKPTVERDPAPKIDLCANDKEPPVFKSCPTNIVKKSVGKCTSVNWNAPSVKDNCTIPTVLMASSPTANLENGGCFPDGTTMVTYTAKDFKGNQSQCAFSVTISKEAVATTTTTPKTERQPSVNKDLPPFPCTDPVCIYLQWKGEKDTKVEMSAQHDGKWSGYQNFGESRSWMKSARVKGANFKFMRQEGALTLGDFAIEAYLRSGTSAEVTGFVILNTPEGRLIEWQKLPTVTLSKSEKTIVGTVNIQTDRLEIKK